MSIKIASGTIVPSSFPRDRETMKTVAAHDTSPLDSFVAHDGTMTSPFLVNRQQTLLDPCITIGEAGECSGHDPWWNDDVLALLNALPPVPYHAGDLTLEVVEALRAASRDTSFLTINWRDE